MLGGSTAQVVELFRHPKTTLKRPKYLTKLHNVGYNCSIKQQNPRFKMKTQIIKRLAILAVKGELADSIYDRLSSQEQALLLDEVISLSGPLL